ncbi:MAG TPA: hypothetical protein VGG25_02630 [Streptosporangiaceae bacterium]
MSAVKIRLVGTKGECEAAAARIAQVLTVLEISEPYPMRGRSALVRVYIDARIPADRPGERDREVTGGQ